LALAVVATFAACASAPRGDASGAFCIRPTEALTGWRFVKAQGISVWVPPSFTQELRRGNDVYLESGQLRIALGQGLGLDVDTLGESRDEIDYCTGRIGDRPVEIHIMQFTINDPPLAPSGNRGIKYIAYAFWKAYDPMPPVFAYMVSDNRMDLHRWRWVLYSADVGMETGERCYSLKPFPPIGSIVDSAAIAVRMRADTSTLPASATSILLRFDSSGVLDSIRVTSSDLPYPTARSLEAIIGTNVRAHPRGAPWAVELKVTSKENALGYELTDAVTCPP
jgi:hypothetical protein